MCAHSLTTPLILSTYLFVGCNSPAAVVTDAGDEAHSTADFNRGDTNSSQRDAHKTCDASERDASSEVSFSAPDGDHTASDSVRRDTSPSALDARDTHDLGGTRDVVLQEVQTLPSDTQQPTSCEREGEDWCFVDFSYDQEVVDLCDRDSVTCVGETVADFSLQNCHSGEMVSVWSLMEDLRAFLLVATSGWCEYCDNWVPQVIDQTDGTAVEGLGGLVVFGEDSDGERPDLEECRSYAERLGRDASRFYIDHAYATTFDNIFCHPDEQLVFDLPWSAVIDPATKELVYVDRADQTNLQEALDGLLSQ